MSYLGSPNKQTENDPLLSPSPKHPKRSQRLHKCGAEFIGTYILMVSIGCNSLISNDSPFLGLSIAATLMVMLYAFATVSGSHFNPAVTLAVYLSKPEFSAKTMIFYMIFQVFGAVAGMGTYQGLLGHGQIHIQPQGDFGLVEAVLVEFIFVLLWTLCVLNVNLPKIAQGNEYFGLAIGGAVLSGIYATKNISGAVLNPAVAIAAGVGSTSWTYILPYIIGHMVAAVIAAALYRYLLRPTEFGLEALGVVSKLGAEFLGTFFLVFGVGLYHLAGSAVGTIAMSFGFLLMVNIYMFGNLSGGHLNPAVTIAILLSGRGKITSRKAAMYILTQLIAGLVAGVLFGVVAKKSGKSFPFGVQYFSKDQDDTTKHVYDLGAMIIAEALMTFVLALVVLTVATVKKPLGQFYALAIGLTVIGGGFSLGAISGGHINPAVSLGAFLSSFFTSGAPFKVITVFQYFGAQFLGAGIAACVFSALHVDEFESENDLPN